jgi:hypothetical protein
MSSHGPVVIRLTPKSKSYVNATPALQLSGPQRCALDWGRRRGCGSDDVAGACARRGCGITLDFGLSMQYISD